MTLEKFISLLPHIVSKNTSLSPAWSEENPLFGQCAVVSTLAQIHFGGEMRRASLAGTSFADMGSHYWNVLGDGTEIDFTGEQFLGNKPVFTEYATRTPAYVLSNERTKLRFKELSFNLAKILDPENNLFEDLIYRAGFDAAMDSPCQKMKFGSVAVYQGNQILATAYNDYNPVTKDLCEPRCIRFDIPSRTEPMIGGCDHAEELVMDKVRELGVSLKETSIYIVGLDQKNLPWMRAEAEHTCIRCSSQMYRAKVSSIVVPVKDKGWVNISPRAALESAKLYALQIKKP